MSNHKNHIFTPIATLFRNLQDIGIDETTPQTTTREIKLINTIALFCLIIIGSYTVINVFSYPKLGLLNLLTLLGVLLVFRFNHRRKYVTAKFWFFALLASFFAIANFISPNSAEYYLLCLFTVGTLLFPSNLGSISVLFFVLLATLIPKFSTIEVFVLEEVSRSRLIINSTLGILCMLAIVKYIKSVQSSYQHQLTEQKDRLQQSNQAMQKLFAIVAHDIRSPLIGTNQAMELLLIRELSPEKQQIMLSTIKKQLDSLYENVNELLTWSRNNMQTIVAKPENIHLKKYLQKLVDEFALQASTKNITFQHQADNDLIVYVDLQHLNLVLRNLLVNALKFSHRNSTVEIMTERVKEQVEISVVDYGTGIPAHKIDSLFQNVQEPTWGTAGEKGTGLGLTLVYDLVSINKGSIKVSSTVSQKTCFTITLPNGQEHVSA